MKKIIFLILILLVLYSCSSHSYITSTVNSTETRQNESDYPDNDNCDKALENAEENWIPIWCDEFDYINTPDPSKWYIEHKGDGFGNNELQYYTRRKENVYVENGELRITAKKEYYAGKQYTSAKLMSKGKGDFLYGKIEIKAKLPKGRGTWPAIWMMPTESRYGGWPHSGEIDIMEHVGFNPNRIYGTIHTGNYNHNIGTQKGGSILLNYDNNVFDNYHVYVIEWEPNSIKWFVDGKKYFEFNNDQLTNPDVNPGNWPFDQEFYIILNVAMGGDWGGAQGIDPLFKESSMYVDYVRVYQKDYEAIDKNKPVITNDFSVISSLPNKTKIIWKKAEDDVAVSHYEVYLDGEHFGNTRQPAITLDNLEPETNYELKVIAVDFTNKKSYQVLYKFTSGNYPSILDKIKASSYIKMKGILLEPTNDIDGGQNVGYIDPDDYLIYKVTVPETDTYLVKLRIAAMSGNHTVEIIDYTDETDNVLTILNFDATGDWQNWETITSSESFILTKGTMVLKILAKTKDFNVNWIQFEVVKKINNFD